MSRNAGMDVAVHWTGDWPEHLAPLLSALESLSEVDDAPDGAVAFCPDAAAVRPPSANGHALVAMVPGVAPVFDAGKRPEFLAALRPWADRGAWFITPSTTAATNLCAELNLPADRVRAVPLPLPPERIPPAGADGGCDIVLLPPINFGQSLGTIDLLRLPEIDFRLVFADLATQHMVQPGGMVCAFNVMPGREAVTTADWHQHIDSAGVIVLSTEGSGCGWTLREALATGKPVLAPSTPLVRDHLAAVGASAYLYHTYEARTFILGLVAAMRHDRGPAIGPAAREAVLAERWETPARELLAAFTEAVLSSAPVGGGNGTRPDPASAKQDPVTAATDTNGLMGIDVVRDPLELCVLNPNPSGGGGERFMRELVYAMARHRSRPRVKLVCQVESEVAFDPGAEWLTGAEVEVRPVTGTEFNRAVPREVADADVVYYSWPHRSDPPTTSAPLVCTFHDLNWKHFDVIPAPERARIERQTPLWIAASHAMVHSSEFIRSELHRYYEAPRSLTHVIPTASDPLAVPPSPEEREHVRRRFGLPDRFLLSPNGYHLHKNYPALHSALRILRKDGRPITVVASGSGTEFCNGPDLIGLGYITAAELHALYAECSGMVQTTLYEAGSFPMAEAMAAGKPAAISRIPPIVEQIERIGVVAELFDPLSPEDVAAAMWRLWEGSPATSPETLAANAAAVAARTWDDVADDYLALFARVAH